MLLLCYIRLPLRDSYVVVFWVLKSGTAGALPPTTLSSRHTVIMATIRAWVRTRLGSRLQRQLQIASFQCGCTLFPTTVHKVHPDCFWFRNEFSNGFVGRLLHRG